MTGAGAGGRSGFTHELALCRSPVETLEFVVAFAREGVAAGEPTLLAVRPDAAAAAREAVGTSPYLEVLAPVGQPGRLAGSLRATDALLTDYGSRVPRVRIVNQDPVVAVEHWPEWRRTEAVVNIALAHHRAWAVCVYDRHALTAERTEDLCATHPLMWVGEHRSNDRYQDPARFIAAHADAPPDPVEHTVPAVELIDPSPAATRASVTQLARGSGLEVAAIEGLVFAVGEAVTNAIMHGRPPVVVRLWRQPGRVTATVTDSGRGPGDPFVGLLPPGHPGHPEPRPDGPGLGLWISHQLADLTHRRRPGGYTVGITATRPRTAGHDGSPYPR